MRTSDHSLVYTAVRRNISTCYDFIHSNICVIWKHAYWFSLSTAAFSEYICCGQWSCVSVNISGCWSGRILLQDMILIASAISVSILLIVVQQGCVFGRREVGRGRYVVFRHEKIESGREGWADIWSVLLLHIQQLLNVYIQVYSSSCMDWFIHTPRWLKKMLLRAKTTVRFEPTNACQENLHCLPNTLIVYFEH